MHTNDERLTDIEVKLAHTEQALNELSDVVYAQQLLLQKLEQDSARLRERMRNMEAGQDTQPGDDKPPHY